MHYASEGKKFRFKIFALLQTENNNANNTTTLQILKLILLVTLVVNIILFLNCYHSPTINSYFTPPPPFLLKCIKNSLFRSNPLTIFCQLKKKKNVRDIAKSTTINTYARSLKEISRKKIFCSYDYI